MKLMDLTEEQAPLRLDTSKLLTDDVKFLGEIFADEGFEVRVVGGAVRDAMLGKEPKDLDLATNATPDQMLELAAKHNLHTIPTGLQHGTLTFHINDEDYEVTTLRIDTDHTGRHATVEWTTSFEEDAARRDLTINAMSMDMSGRVYDYFGGAEDLKAGKVKTVGSASARFEEDFLRILRFFRFYGRQATPNMDRETLNAIRDKAPGLKRISGERIWMEMSKILTGDHVGDILDFMTDTDVNGYIGLPVNNVTATEIVAKVTDNPISILTMLLKSESQFAAIVDHWKLSNPEKQLGYFIMQNRGTMIDNERIARNLIISGAKPEHVAELAAIQGRSNLIGKIKNMAVPEFPVSGKDLVALGMKPGPDMGKALAKMKGHWVASLDGTPKTKEELLKLL